MRKLNLEVDRATSVCLTMAGLVDMTERFGQGAGRKELQNVGIAS